MTIELKMLAYSVGLLLVLVLVQALVGILQYGAVPLAGPRDGLEPPRPLQARAKRVVDNHREGLTLFAPLVLIAAVAGVHSLDKCRVRTSGLSYLVDIQVRVPGDMTVREGHGIAHRVKDTLLSSGLRVSDVTVHVEPQ